MKISLTEQVIWRFIVSGVYGAVSVIGVATYYTGVQTWEDFGRASGLLGLALAVGFVNGVLMSVHKYFTGATVSTDLVTEMPEALTE